MPRNTPRVSKMESLNRLRLCMYVPPKVHRRDENDFTLRNDFNFSSSSSLLRHRRREWFLVTQVPDQSVKPLTISHNRISKGVESAKRLHRYLNFADDGNHARSTLQLHVSSGFCASVTLRSGVTQRGSQDRVLFVNLYPPELLLHPFAHFFLLRSFDYSFSSFR